MKYCKQFCTRLEFGVCSLYQTVYNNFVDVALNSFYEIIDKLIIEKMTCKLV